MIIKKGNKFILTDEVPEGEQVEVVDIRVCINRFGTVVSVSITDEIQERTRLIELPELEELMRSGKMRRISILDQAIGRLLDEA